MVIPWVFDTEVYPNCFIGVFYNPKTDTHKTFGFWEHIDDRLALVKFLTDPQNIFIGYNTINFDGNLLQAFIEDPEITHEELRELRDQCIASRTPLIPEWDRDFVEYDLFRIWHYNNKNRMTSLKHLEFVYRLRSIKDLPYHHDSLIKTQTAYDNVAAYCKYDVIPTTIHFRNTLKRIKGRHEVMKRFNLNVRNASDAKMGLEIILYNIAKRKGCEIRDLKKLWTEYDKIEIKDIPLPAHRARGGICEELIDTHFDTITLISEFDPDSGRKVINLKGHLYEFLWQGVSAKVGFGGIHGCTAKGVYESDDEWVIKSSDVTSQYPNATILQGIYPAHLGPMFLDVYDNDVYQERAKYPKQTHFEMNQTYKLACNAAVGQFADKYSPLYDVKCNLRVTINCQLSILSLAEDLVKAIPKAKLLMLNTDGIEIMIPRESEALWVKVCAKWERNTKFQLEHEDYNKLVINNVNNYLAEFASGKIKRKGLFRIYEDYIDQDAYHNDPSATIIPAALSAYFVNGTPIEETVNNCEDIHEFIFGVKKTKAFNYAVVIANPDRTIRIRKFKERVFRYYISDSVKSGNLVKLWKDGRMNQVNKGDLIMPAVSVRSPKASKHTDLDRSYYINKAHEIRSEIEF